MNNEQRTTNNEQRTTNNSIILQHLDLDIPKMNLRALGLEADVVVSQFALVRADFSAVDFGSDGAVAVANDLGRVPFADRLGGLVAGFDVILALALVARNKEQFPVAFVHALNLNAIGPNADDALFRIVNVHQSAGVAVELAVVGQARRARIAPVVAHDVVFVALVGVDESRRMTFADDYFFFDAPGLGGIGPLFVKLEFASLEIFAV